MPQITSFVTSDLSLGWVPNSIWALTYFQLSEAVSLRSMCWICLFCPGVPPNSEASAVTHLACST